MKTEPAGICVRCAVISQADTDEFLLAIPIMHTPLYLKRALLLASCEHHLASGLSAAICFSSLAQGMWQHK